MNHFGIAALGAALEILLEAGEDAIERQVRLLTDRLVVGLVDRGFHVVSSRRDGEWSPIVAATHRERSPADLVRALAQRGISVAHRSGRLRVSPHFYTREEELDEFASMLTELREKRAWRDHLAKTAAY